MVGVFDGDAYGIAFHCGGGAACNRVSRHIEEVAFGIYIWQLSEEFVERLRVVGETIGRTEGMPGDAEIFVNIDRVICPLVPNLTSRRPCSRNATAINGDTAFGTTISPRIGIVIIVVIVVVLASGKEDFGMSIAVDIGDYRVFAVGGIVGGEGCAEGVECGSVHDVEVLDSLIDYFVAAVLVEVEDREACCLAKGNMAVHEAHVASQGGVVGVDHHASFSGVAVGIVEGVDYLGGTVAIKVSAIGNGGPVACDHRVTVMCHD